MPNITSRDGEFLDLILIVGVMSGSQILNALSTTS